MSTNAISGEQSNTKFLAVFDTEAELEQCRIALEQAGYDPNQLAVITPGERHYGRKLEPEAQGIFRTAIKAHTLFGLIGFALAIAIWGGLYLAGIPIIVASPLISLVPFVFILTSVGLLLGGLITFRPDQLVVIQGVKSAQRAGRWSLVVHSRNATQSVQVQQWFDTAGIPVVHSL